MCIHVLLFQLFIFAFTFYPVLLYLQVDIDFENEPIGTGKDGNAVYFKDVWPTSEEIAQANFAPCFCL